MSCAKCGWIHHPDTQCPLDRLDLNFYWPPARLNPKPSLLRVRMAKLEEQVQALGKRLEKLEKVP